MVSGIYHSSISKFKAVPSSFIRGRREEVFTLKRKNILFFIYYLQSTYFLNLSEFQKAQNQPSLNPPLLMATVTKLPSLHHSHLPLGHRLN